MNPGRSKGPERLLGLESEQLEEWGCFELTWSGTGRSTVTLNLLERVC